MTNAQMETLKALIVVKKFLNGVSYITDAERVVVSTNDDRSIVIRPDGSVHYY